MKKMLPVTTFLLLLGVMTSLEGCDLFNIKEPKPKPKTELEKLPPATQEGKNTFGCLVDGKAWVTKSSIDADAFYQEGVLSISAVLTNKDFNQGIGFVLLENNLEIKEYILSDYPEAFAQLGDLRTNCGFQTSYAYTGKLTITHFDQTNFIISGTFEFEAYSDDCDKIIKVTHGRFDLNYAP